MHADIMGYYSRQACGKMIRTVFKNVGAQLTAQQAELEQGLVSDKAGHQACMCFTAVVTLGAAMAACIHPATMLQGWHAACGVVPSRCVHPPAVQPLSEPQCRYGVRAALNILEFLIDLLQKVQPVSSGQARPAHQTASPRVEL